MAAPLYDLPLLQQWVYRPAHDEVIAALDDRGIRGVADVACGTGISGSAADTLMAGY